MRRVEVNLLLSPDDQLALLPLVPGSEWLEALISTGIRYPVPRHGDASRWDWGTTAKSMGYAMERSARLTQIASELTPAQRAALWADPSPEAARMRKALR